VTSLSRRSFRMFRSIVHVNRIYNTVSNLIDDKCDTLLDDVLINSVGILEDFLLVKCNTQPTFNDSSKLHCFAIRKMYNLLLTTHAVISQILLTISLSQHTRNSVLIFSFHNNLFYTRSCILDTKIIYFSSAQKY
jgi:hypothetical protein